MAIWAANLPEWFFAEFGAALAGLTLVTANPAYLAAELAYVLEQSRACGVIVQDHYRGRDLLAAVAAAREALPLLREVIALTVWREFAASGAREIALPIHRLPTWYDVDDVDALCRLNAELCDVPGRHADGQIPHEASHTTALMRSLAGKHGLATRNSQVMQVDEARA